MGFKFPNFGTLASNSKGIGKSLGSIGQGMGSGLSGVFSPFMQVENQLFGQADDFFSLGSPLLYGILGVGGLLILTSIFKGASVANNGISAVRENPEIAAMAIKAAQAGL